MMLILQRKTIHCLMIVALLVGAHGRALGQERLDRSECRRLFQHQLALITAAAQANPDFDQTRLNELNEEDGVSHCLQHTTRESFECQMNASQAPQLVVCQQRHDREPTDARDDLDQMDNTADDPENSDEPDPEPTTIVTDQLPTGEVEVTEGNCRRSYEHMLNIVRQDSRFRAREDRSTLVSLWSSNAARTAFEQRCQAEFQPRDLGCLLGSRDMDVLQGCLLVIPG